MGSMSATGKISDLLAAYTIVLNVLSFHPYLQT